MLPAFCLAVHPLVEELTLAHTLARLIAAPEWKPVPVAGSLRLVEPLLRHWEERLPLPQGILHKDPVRPNRALFEGALRAWSARAAVLDQLLSESAELRIGPIVAIQGTGIAPLHPSPALRVTADIDLLLPAEQARQLSRLMIERDWRRSANAWIHPSGVIADLHTPADRFARRLIETASPDPRLPGALLPEAAHHVALIAHHSAHHQGDRLWRDLSDLQLLLGTSPQACAEQALSVAPDVARGPLNGLLAFLSRWGHQGPLPHDAARGEGYFAFCTQQALDPTPAATYEALESLLASPASATSARPGPARRGPAARRIDPDLGLLPRPGLRLLLWKATLLLREALAGRLPSRLRRVRARRLSRPKSDLIRGV